MTMGVLVPIGSVSKAGILIRPRGMNRRQTLKVNADVARVLGRHYGRKAAGTRGAAFGAGAITGGIAGNLAHRRQAGEGLSKGLNPGTYVYQPQEAKGMTAGHGVRRPLEEIVAPGATVEQVAKGLVDVGNAKALGREAVRGARRRRGTVGVLAGAAGENLLQNRRRAQTPVAKRAMGPGLSVRGAGGRFASHAQDFTLIHITPKHAPREQATVIRRNPSRTGGLAPVGTRRTANRPGSSKMPDGARRGQRLG